MNHRNIQAVSISIILTSIITGCTTPGTLEDAENRDRGIGTVVGAILGAAVGDQVAKHTGGDRDTGRIIGGALGAGGGYLAGDAMADKRRQYANDLQAVDSSVAQTEQYINKMQHRANVADSKAKEQQQKLIALQADVSRGKRVNQEALQLLSSIDTQLNFTESTIQETQGKINALNMEINNTVSTGTQSPENLVKLRELKSMQRDTLLAQLDTLTNAKQTMLAQRNTINNLSKS